MFRLSYIFSRDLAASIGPHVGPSVGPSVKKNSKKVFGTVVVVVVLIFGRMCAAMSPKERKISKPVAASMAFAMFEIIFIWCV